FGMIENQFAEGVAIDEAVGIEDPHPKLADHRVVRFGAGKQNLVTQLVRFDQVTSEITQGVPDEALAAGQAAREPYAEHKRCSAARTVLDMSMAMVSGPTPPGTGV